MLKIAQILVHILGGLDSVFIFWAVDIASGKEIEKQKAQWRKKCLGEWYWFWAENEKKGIYVNAH